jgi:UDP-3-O-[3-hydroxymyristoyl] glucosamine N-acyltransferase
MRNMPVSLTLAQLAAEVGGSIDDRHADIPIRAVNSLSAAAEGEISFLSQPRNKPELRNTRASAVILREKDKPDCPVAVLIVDNPHAAFARVATLLHPAPRQPAGIHPSAVIDSDCEIADDVAIGPHVSIGREVKIGSGSQIGAGCVIEDGVIIGRNTILHPNVSIMYDCRLGDNVILHSGVVIGSDGFGQARDDDRWLKVPQIGRVILGDDVEIGANSVVDRGAIEDTIIEEGVKLDNLIQIAHNVRLGAHTVMAANCAVAGSTRIGKNCMIGGQVGISGHLTIADNVTLTGGTTVLQSIKEAGVYSSGTPHESNRQWHKNFLRFRELDKMSKRIRELEKKLAEQESKG